MDRLVQCVPNFSEGRDRTLVEKIVGAIEGVEGIRLLDYSLDGDHNRAVVTFVGEPQAVLEAAYQGARKAVELIDMEKHQGSHPRMGAVDVIPFIPIKDVSMEEAIGLANALGERLAKELDLPVYLYEEAARVPERKNLADVRRGEYEGLKENIENRKPDYGPSRVHPTAGATIVGARMPLVAFNVNLDTADIKVAKQIAKSVRQASGGLSNVKAIGLALEDRVQVQVSMNMVNYVKTPLYRALELIKAEARRYGVRVSGTELIGLVPQQALVDSLKYYMQLEDFSENQILENRLWQE